MKIKIKSRFAAVLLCIFLLFLSGFAFLQWLGKVQQPNIILITLDALRPDHLGCYGYARNTSPTIDNLASQGVRFSHYITPSSHTSSSNASLITSTYPNIHNVKDWGYQFSPRISMTLPMILKEHGYDTAFISDQLALPLIKGFEKGFDTFNTINAFTFGSNLKRKRIVEITDWAISWLKNNKGKKFFLWLYYLSPHGPYLPSSPYDGMFVNDKYYSVNKRVPISLDMYSQSTVGTIPRYLIINGANEVDYYVSQYDGEIRRVDDQIARLLLELKNEGLYKNSIIIVNSDHGEALGEHDRYFCHANSLYDELIRAPLIVWGRNMPSGRMIASQVRTIDIMPTILNILRIRFKNLQGESLLPLIMKKTDNLTLFAYSEQSNLISIRTNKWKLIYNRSNGQYELYDLKNDPKESDDISAKEIGIFGYFKDELNNYLIKSAPMKKSEKIVISEEDREKLRMLGYTQ